MTTNAAFNHLTNIRNANRVAGYQFAIVSLKKDGTPSKPASLTSFNAAADRSAAEAIQARLAQLNPGRTYVIIPA